MSTLKGRTNCGSNLELQDAKGNTDSGGKVTQTQAQVCSLIIGKPGNYVH